MREEMAKVLPFARRPAEDEPSLDVCLAMGDQQRRYLVAKVTAATWEGRVDGPGRAEHRLMSRAEARRWKAEFELEIATHLGAGWVVEWHK